VPGPNVAQGVIAGSLVVMDPPVAPHAGIADRYRFDEVIGRGGMGTVWKATDLLLERQVAIKDMLLPPQPDSDERNDARARLLREAHAAARHDVVEEGDRLFLVMEYVDGPSLETLVLRQGPLPPDEVAAAGWRIAGALASAHTMGIVHRDVKPSNVLVPGAAASAKLVDFGIAALADSPALTAAGFVMGSPSYMSPEQAEGGRATTASDVFSLGATLYFAVEGSGPFQRENTVATIAAVANQPPAEPQRAGPLGPLLLAMMAKDPLDRPSMGDVRTRLAELAGIRPAPTAPAPAVGSPPPVMARGWSVPTGDTRQNTPRAVPAQAPSSAAAPPDRPPGHTRLVPSLQDRPRGEEPVDERRRGRRILTGAAVVLLAGAIVAAATYDDTESTAPTTTTPPAPTTTTEPEPTTTTEPGGLPAGFVEYADPQGGFTIALPDDMDVTVNETDHLSEFVSGDTRVAVRWFSPAIDQQAFVDSERNRLSGFPGYEEIAFEEQAFRDSPGFFWEFEFAQPSDPDPLLHSTGRVFTMGEGDTAVTYALFFRSAADEFDALEDEFALIEDSFVPLLG
jgi:eukaryotic-like serine/threonine-protein kinase